MKVIIWFKRPGTASIFKPNSGIAHACKTSPEVTKKRNVILIGTTKRLSTSNKRLVPKVKLSVKIILLSNLNETHLLITLPPSFSNRMFLLEK